MPICKAAGNKSMNSMFAPPLFLALMNGDPTTEGLLTQEMSGEGYVRKPVTFTTSTAMSVSNVETVDWSDLPTTPIRYIAVCTLISGGEVVAYKTTGGDVVVAEGYKFIIGYGQLAFSLVPVT